MESFSKRRDYQSLPGKCHLLMHKKQTFKTATNSADLQHIYSNNMFVETNYNYCLILQVFFNKLLTSTYMASF